MKIWLYTRVLLSAHLFSSGMFNRNRSKESVEMPLKHHKNPKIKSLSDFKKVFILSEPYFAAMI